VGELIAPPGIDSSRGDPEQDSIAARTARSPFSPAANSRTEGWRRAEIPAANGHGNARSVARVQTIIANGGSAFGVDLMSPAGCARIFDEQTNGQDLVLGVPMRFGMGFGLNTPDWRLSPNPNTCFWGGWGGSLVVIDTDARLCFSYVMNRMTETTLGDKRAAALAYSTYECLADA
jgi:CubicO group peptidase (beta-lactamase class C family)